jgi:hypothetical protein
MGDFDHDGICDVFWDDDHGANAVTSTPLSGVIPAQPRAADVVVADAVAGTSKWQLVGSGDFTADGRDDILWWNPGKGRLRLWVADEEGHFPLSLRQTLTGWPDTQWEPLATADLDGGPIPHVIWRNKVTGKLYHWLGLSPTTSGYLTPDSTAAMNWRIVAAGDFDGDGKADLLWQNQEDQSRKVVIWFMNGPVRRTGSLTTPDRFGPVLDPTVEWNIVGPR